MDAWQDRAIVEWRDLKEKTLRLQLFINYSPTFKGLSDEEQDLLNQQFEQMVGYAGLLVKRLELSAQKAK